MKSLFFAIVLLEIATMIHPTWAWIIEPTISLFMLGMLGLLIIDSQESN